MLGEFMMWSLIFRLTFLSTLGIGVVHGAEWTVRCSEGSSGYYDNSRNCTFREVNVDDVSERVSFVNNRYNSPYYFQFTESKLVEIPKNIFVTYSTVQYLNVAECYIESISRYTFENANQLILLNLSTNSLQELKNYVFTGASKLSHLDLSNNNISVIEEKAFSNLNELAALFLPGNALKSLEGAVFAPLLKLRKINLARNQLEILPKELFSLNTQLTMIYMPDNQLVLLDDDLFQNIERLEYVWLKNNNLTSIVLTKLKSKVVSVANNKLKKIKISASIEQLSAANNNIAELEADDFTALKLKKLDLSWNNLTSLGSIGQISTLQVLDMSHNSIGPLELTSFAKLSELIDLNLEETKISNLQHGTFSQLSALKRLDISYNNLNRIDLNIFTSSQQLEELYIDGNRLKQITYLELRLIFPALKKISIADNNWNCTFLTRMIRGLNALNAGVVAVGGFKTETVITDKTNVKGIYCSDDTHPLAAWNVTAKHLDKYLNDSAPIFDTTEIKQIMQGAVDDIGKFNEQKAALTNTSERLEGEIQDLTRKLMSLESDIIEVKKSILQVKMVQLANATNETHTATDLRRMMTELNDWTLAKLNQTGEVLQFKIYQQSFKIDKFIDKVNENADKLAVLYKQLSSQNGNPMFASYSSPVATNQELKSAAAASAPGNSQLILIVILVVLVTLLAGALALVYRNRRSAGLRTKSHYGTSNTLTTIMDNDM